jgi:hypothetical protein
LTTVSQPMWKKPITVSVASTAGACERNARSALRKKNSRKVPRPVNLTSSTEPALGPISAWTAIKTQVKSGGWFGL